MPRSMRWGRRPPGSRSKALAVPIPVPTATARAFPLWGHRDLELGVVTHDGKLGGPDPEPPGSAAQRMQRRLAHNLHPAAVTLRIIAEIAREVPIALPAAAAKKTDWEQLYRRAPCHTASHAASSASMENSRYQPARTASTGRPLVGGATSMLTSRRGAARLSAPGVTSSAAST